RSPSIGSGTPVTKAGVLQEAVRRFLERHPRPKQGRSGPEGWPADPRWTNPSSKDWCASVTSMLPTSGAPPHGAEKHESPTHDTALGGGLTVAWHASLRELEDEDGTIKFSDQAKLKGPWEEFRDCVTLLGKQNKTVWVTVRTRAEWEIVRGQPSQ